MTLVSERLQSAGQKNIVESCNQTIMMMDRMNRSYDLMLMMATAMVERRPLSIEEQIQIDTYLSRREASVTQPEFPQPVEKHRDVMNWELALKEQQGKLKVSPLPSSPEETKNQLRSSESTREEKFLNKQDREMRAEGRLFRSEGLNHTNVVTQPVEIGNERLRNMKEEQLQELTTAKEIWNKTPKIDGDVVTCQLHMSLVPLPGNSEVTAGKIERLEIPIDDFEEETEVQGKEEPEYSSLKNCITIDKKFLAAEQEMMAQKSDCPFESLALERTRSNLGKATGLELKGLGSSLGWILELNGPVVSYQIEVKSLGVGLVLEAAQQEINILIQQAQLHTNSIFFIRPNDFSCPISSPSNPKITIFSTSPNIFSGSILSSSSLKLNSISNFNTHQLQRTHSNSISLQLSPFLRPPRKPPDYVHHSNLEDKVLLRGVVCHG